jgi:hypothetical protein
MQKSTFPWWKLILGYALYVLFHQAYEMLGGNLLGQTLGEGIGGVYPHMKMLFYAYLVLCAIDYFRLRKTGSLGTAFFHSRMLILAAVPWMMTMMYYAIEAVGINLPKYVDLTWALICTAFGLYFCFRLEEPFDHLTLRPAAQAMIVFAFVTALVTYVGFSFRVPDNFFSVLE